MSPNPQDTADLVTFTEETLNGKLHCAVYVSSSEYARVLNIPGFWYAKVINVPRF